MNIFLTLDSTAKSVRTHTIPSYSLHVVKEVLGGVQADLIDMRTKPNGEYVWILHLKNHFSKFSMLYALTSKRASEITYYISLFVRHLGIPGVSQYDNGREFKGALLLLLKKHNIRLVNGRPRTPRTQGLVEQANAMVKDKITKWQAVNGSSIQVTGQVL